MQQMRRIGRQASAWRVLAPALLVALLALGALPAQAAGLNDTGFTTCIDGSSNTAACASAATDFGTYPRQDGRYGRDPAAAASQISKVGAGRAAFDFTKIANDGSDLPASAATLGGSNPGDWACTKDNVTGLTWELKTTDGGLHDVGHNYTWYDTNNATNGGDPGVAGDPDPANTTCNNTLATCDTATLIATVNAAQLCGHSDWRLPTLLELQSLVDYSLAGSGTVAIDADYFPNIYMIQWFPAYWSATSFQVDPAQVWLGDFYHGSNTNPNPKSSTSSAALVRNGP